MGGAEALRQQAISDALPDLYARAVVDTEVDPIAAPEIDITSGEAGGPLTFDALVEVRPTVSIAGYGGLVVTVPAVAVTVTAGGSPAPASPCRVAANPKRRPSISTL